LVTWPIIMSLSKIIFGCCIGGKVVSLGIWLSKAYQILIMKWFLEFSWVHEVYKWCLFLKSLMCNIVCGKTELKDMIKVKDRQIGRLSLIIMMG
jgi:hypothetical protein